VSKKLKQEANQQIFEALQTWGLQPQIDGAGVICGLGPLRAKCVDVQISHGGKMASLIIDLIVEPASNLVLRENVMQIGDSTSQAIGGAVYLWTFSVFVAVAGFLDAEGCPGHMAGQDEREFADQFGNIHSWKICSSPFMMMGSSDEVEENRAEEAKSDYHPSTLPLIEPFLPALAVEPQLYTVKAFLMNSGVGEIYGDCTINGVSSEELLEAVKQFAWPPGEGLRSVRQYHVIVPADFKIDMAVPSPVPQKQGLLGKLFGRA
jgi:hypothetical protein